MMTWERGCELPPFSGFSSEETLGYAGPTSSRRETPSAASRCRDCTKSRRIPSRGQVGGMFRHGVDQAAIGGLEGLFENAE